MTNILVIRVGVDKSLAPPGRKQPTANKLGIFSTYSPRSSIHFLTHCSNFRKPLKKKNQKLVRPTRYPRQQWPPRQTKNCFQFIFQSREQVVVRWDQIRRIRWVIKTLEAQVGQFLLGYKCPVSRGIVVQEQDLLGDLPVVFFLYVYLQTCKTPTRIYFHFVLLSSRMFPVHFFLLSTISWIDFSALLGSACIIFSYCMLFWPLPLVALLPCCSVLDPDLVSEFYVEQNVWYSYVHIFDSIYYINVLLCKWPPRRWPVGTETFRRSITKWQLVIYGYMCD